MKAKSLIGFVLLAGIVLSALEWISIENTRIAIPTVLITIILSSFLYLKLYKTVHNIDMSTSEFAMELFKISIVILMLVSPIICFGRVIFSSEKVNSPGIVVAYILIPVIFLTLVNVLEFSPPIRKLKPVTEQKIIDALRELEKRLNVHIENVYLLDRGLERAEVNAYQVGLRKFRIFVTEKLLSALSAEEILGVLAHEVVHAQRKHTLKIFLGGLFVVFIEIMIALLLLRRAVLIR